MRHVREEARLQLVGAAEMIGFFVELRVERDDAAVRVLELPIEVHELLLLPLKLVERAQQLLVLLLDFFGKPAGRACGDVLCEPPDARRASPRAGAAGRASRG